jgi:hypothetical protein
MSKGIEGAAGPSHRLVELGVAIAMAVFALLVIGGSMAAGIDWGAEGPRAGFFPFYVGVMILVASAVNFLQIRAGRGDRLFAEWGQLRQVLAVVIPSTLYVLLVPWIGIYVASVLLIAVFMRWLGRYGWGLVALVSVGVPVITFVIFEKWFLVPLPKGPIEDLLRI